MFDVCLVFCCSCLFVVRLLVCVCAGVFSSVFVSLLLVCAVDFLCFVVVVCVIIAVDC